MSGGGAWGRAHEAPPDEEREQGERKRGTAGEGRTKRHREKRARGARRRRRTKRHRKKRGGDVGRNEVKNEAKRNQANGR